MKYLSGLLFIALLLTTRSFAVAADSDTIALKNAVTAQREGLENFKAYLEINVHLGAEQKLSEAQMAYERQTQNFYLKTFAPLVPHAFTLLANEHEFWLQVPKLAVIFTGPLESVAQEQFQLKLTPQDIKQLLIPDAILEDPNQLAISQTDGHWLIKVYSEAGQTKYESRRLWLDPETLRLFKEERLSPNGETYLELEWNDFDSGSAANTFPRKLIMRRPLRGYEVIISIKDYAVNSKLPADLFELKRRADYSIEHVQ